MDWFQLIHLSVHPSAHAGGGGSIPAGRVFASRHRGSVLLIFRSYMRAQPGNRPPFCFLAKGPATAPFNCLGASPHPKWGDPLVCYDGELLGRRVPPWPVIYQGSNSPVLPSYRGRNASLCTLRRMLAKSPLSLLVRPGKGLGIPVL